MSLEKRAANAAGARTARPCDNCACKRARWYCAADDAFLCQACDASVHSANPLARRHERLSLKSACLPPLRLEPEPSWLRRKARTPRGSSKAAQPSPPPKPAHAPLLVPDLSPRNSPHDDDDDNDDQEQLLYRVPTFDPVPVPVPVHVPDHSNSPPLAATAFELMSDIEACDADLAADVESLLGKGFDDEETFCMEALGLLQGPGEGHNMEWRVKMEDDGDALDRRRVVDAADALDFKFGFETFSPPAVATASEDVEEEDKADNNNNNKKKKICLRLNHEAVMTAWATQGSPWTTGCRPHLNPDDSWPEWMGPTCGWEEQQPQWVFGDSGREAKVSRYREKRRSRLFSKKIRYEVRKLNAEKRPRMKGRFVKRASLHGLSF